MPGHRDRYAFMMRLCISGTAIIGTARAALAGMDAARAANIRRSSPPE